MPEVINHSIELLSNGGLGMAMFSLGMLYINYEQCYISRKITSRILQE